MNDGSPPGLSTPSQRVIACARESASATSRATPCAISPRRPRVVDRELGRGAVVAEPVGATVADPRHREERTVDHRRDEGARRRVRRRCRRAAADCGRRGLRGRGGGDELFVPVLDARTAGRSTTGAGAAASTSRAARAAASAATSLSVALVTPSHTTSTMRSRRGRERDRVLVARVMDPAVAHGRDVAAPVAR